MKEYKIPVCWQMYGHVTVKSDTIEHAAQIAETDMGIGLPEGSYVEASWEVDWDTVNEKIVNSK